MLPSYAGAAAGGLAAPGASTTPPITTPPQPQPAPNPFVPQPAPTPGAVPDFKPGQLGGGYGNPGAGTSGGLQTPAGGSFGGPGNDPGFNLGPAPSNIASMMPGAMPQGGLGGTSMSMPRTPAPMQMGPMGPMIHDGNGWQHYNPTDIDHVHAAYGGQIPPDHPVYGAPPGFRAPGPQNTGGWHGGGGNMPGPPGPPGVNPGAGQPPWAGHPFASLPPAQQAAANAARQARIVQDQGMHAGGGGQPGAHPDQWTLNPNSPRANNPHMSWEPQVPFNPGAPPPWAHNPGANPPSVLPYQPPGIYPKS
jgi:integrin beta 8